MNSKPTKLLIAVLWSVSFSLMPDVEAAGLEPQDTDIALQNGGVLVGQVVDAQGKQQPAAPVVLFAAGKEVARCQTDNVGRFTIAGLQGGVVEIATTGSQKTCRLWAPQTAPPAARNGLLMVTGNEIACGQNCGCTMGCGSAVCGCGGHGGGLLGVIADHPVVAAGVIGAAIAIPIAVSNGDSSPSTPSGGT